MPLRFRHALFFLILAAAAAQAEVSLTVKSLSREQTEAFYLARGFTSEAIAAYASACVLSFSFANGNGTKLGFQLADWTAGNGVRFRPVTDWETELKTEWEKRGVPPAARIAFRWAQFPSEQEEQEFEAGDWIMGMAVPEHRIVGPFRVTARYSDNKGPHELVTDTISCAN